MLTVMCPNCRLRFPAHGCCNPNSKIEDSTMQSVDCSGNYYSCGGLLVPRGYHSGGGCIINAPTIIHGPAIIQSNGQTGTNKIDAPSGIFSTDQLLKNQEKNIINLSGLRSNNPECQINKTCDVAGSTMTITTPKIQSGGCLIQSTDLESFLQAPRIEIRPKLSGGGCLVQKRLSTEDSPTSQVIFTDNGCVDTLSDIKYYEDSSFTEERLEDLILPPSGCQELPGIRRNSSTKSPVNDLSSISQDKNSTINSHHHKLSSGCCCNSKLNSCHGNLVTNPCQTSTSVVNGVEARKSSSTDDPGAVQIQVNATIQLPPNVGQCTVNITAMTSPNTGDGGVNGIVKSKNNFNGGGLMQMDNNPTVLGENERRDDAPTTPVSWLMPPFSWGFDNYPQDKDLVKLTEIKRLLHTSGWYHEGLSWQQSENLLKNVPIGRWLMRDSSDSRYTFAISVQTNRGPTSVRVHYYFGQFRLDAEPRLVLAMPQFDCPIKMLEYYVEYSRIEENRREVWVDYSGQLYSQIYLTKPLIKQVRSLSHLARLVVNKHKLNTDHLPLPIKNYLAEYPYSF